MRYTQWAVAACLTPWAPRRALCPLDRGCPLCSLGHYACDLPNGPWLPSVLLGLPRVCSTGNAVAGLCATWAPIHALCPMGHNCSPCCLDPQACALPNGLWVLALLSGPQCMSFSHWTTVVFSQWAMAALLTPWSHKHALLQMGRGCSSFSLGSHVCTVPNVW